MNLADLMDEVASVLATFTGLRVHAHPPGSVTPPAGVVSYPEQIEFDATYGRGVDKISGLPIILVTSKVTDRAARDTVSAWAAGGGAGSIKAAFEAHRWASCSDLTISDCSFDTVTIAGVDYLAVTFSADAVGRGA